MLRGYNQEQGILRQNEISGLFARQLIERRKGLLLGPNFNARAFGEFAAGQDYNALADNSVNFSGRRSGCARSAAFVGKGRRIHIPSVTLREFLAIGWVIRKLRI